MIKKLLILSGITMLLMVLTGCPSDSVKDRIEAKQKVEDRKQEIQNRSDRQFEDMEQQMSK